MHDSVPWVIAKEQDADWRRGASCVESVFG